jgi:hypothetical protein
MFNMWGPLMIWWAVGRCYVTADLSTMTIFHSFNEIGIFCLYHECWLIGGIFDTHAVDNFGTGLWLCRLIENFVDAFRRKFACFWKFTCCRDAKCDTGFRFRTNLLQTA